MVKHTTGRLEVVGNMVRTHLTDGGYLVAEFRDANGNPHTEEAMANAVLFCGAHGLVQAIQAAMNCIVDLPPTQARVETLHMLQDAIRNAGVQ